MVRIDFIFALESLFGVVLITLLSPGEKLPEYPRKTHFWSRTRNHNHSHQQEVPMGLKPPLTVGDALSSIPANEKQELRNVHRIDFDAPFLNTLTTGSHSFLSNQHKALLQTFPLPYRFFGNKTEVSRQSQYKSFFGTRCKCSLSWLKTDWHHDALKNSWKCISSSVCCCSVQECTIAIERDRHTSSLPTDGREY